MSVLDNLDIQGSQSRNGSFENGVSPWQVGGTSGFAIYADGQITPNDTAFSGTHYAAFNTSSPGGSIYEDIPMAINPGDTFCGSAEVRDQLQETGARRPVRDLAHGGRFERGWVG